MPNTDNIAFSKPDIDTQLDLIKKELKGKDFPTIEKCGHKIQLNPLYTESKNTVKLFPSLQYKLNIQKFKLNKSDLKSTNNSMIDALNNGVNCLMLDIDNQSISTSELSQLFENIQLNHIYTIVENIDSTFIDSIEIHLSERYTEFDLSRLSINTDLEHEFSSFIELKDSDFFNNCESIISSIDEYRNVMLNIELTNDFYWDVAKIRAFKTLLLNYIEKDNLDTEIIFIANQAIDYSQELQFPERNILKLSISSLSALMATCDGVYNTSFKDDSAFSNRISRNIFNILSEESYINLVNDIGAGSYYLDNYTEEVAKLIYKTLK